MIERTFPMILVLVALSACAPAPPAPRASAPLAADCFAVFSVLARGESRCGIALDNEGRVTVGGRQGGPLLVSVNNGPSGETRQYAESLRLFPASTNHRFIFAVGCPGEGPCWASLVFDLEAGVARKTEAGRYGPQKFIAWSPDGDRAALLYRAEGASWLYVVDGRTGESFHHPPYGAGITYDYRQDSLTWLTAREIRVLVRHCPLDADCTQAAGGYAERIFTISDQGLLPR